MVVVSPLSQPSRADLFLGLADVLTENNATSGIKTNHVTHVDWKGVKKR